MQENRKKILFDMDGTLHPIREKSFIDSKVHEVMVGRSIEYVMNELELGKDEASKIFNEIIENYPRFYSVGLKEKRGLDRWRYLDFAWNINPEGIVERVPGLLGMLEGLSTVGDLYVVSDAPRVWMNNVLKHLQIRDKFTEIYSGTNLNLKKKQGLFGYVLGQLGVSPNRCYMVGDEFENDIRPANKEGISTVFIGLRNCEESDYWIQNILQLTNILGRNNDKGN